MDNVQIYRFEAGPAIRTFLENSIFARSDVAGLIVDLCSDLLFIREEGTELSPTFVVSASESDTLAAFGANGVHAISFVPDVELTSRVLVKQLAVLSSGCWLPCLQVAPNSCRPTLVLSRSDPFNTPVNRAHHRAIGKSMVLIERTRPGVLELRRYPTGATLQLIANPTCATGKAGAGPFEHFSNSVAPSPQFGPPAKERLKTVLRTAVAESHGVLFVVVDPTKSESAFAAFKSSVRLDPFIDLTAGEVVTGAPGDITEAGTIRLQAIVSAVAKTDGIVVFGSDATLRAYSAFVDISESLNAAAGGARTLARVALTQQHAGKFLSLLYRSQDGQAEFIELGIRTGP